MTGDADAVKAALANYLAALNSLDMAKIEPLWAHEDSVTQVEPNSGITVGWNAVKRNLESFCGFFAELKIEVSNGPYVQVVGDVGWTSSIIPVSGKTKTGDAVTLRICTTQVFERRAGMWLVRSNIALPAPQ
jgi:ketosteroid isomerase-like protein